MSPCRLFRNSHPLVTIVRRPYRAEKSHDRQVLRGTPRDIHCRPSPFQLLFRAVIQTIPVHLNAARENADNFNELAKEVEVFPRKVASALRVQGFCLADRWTLSYTASSLAFTFMRATPCSSSSFCSSQEYLNQCTPAAHPQHHLISPSSRHGTIVNHPPLATSLVM